MASHYAQLPLRRRLAAAFVRLLRFLLLITISLFGGFFCIICVRSLVDPPILLSEASAVARGFAAGYWTMLMLAVGSASAMLAAYGLATAIRGLWFTRNTNRIVLATERALKVAQAFSCVVLAGGMVSACIAWMIMLPAKWSHTTGVSTIPVVIEGICAVIWGGFSGVWAIKMPIALMRQIWRGNFREGGQPPMPPSSGNPVPNPRQPRGPKVLQAYARPTSSA